VKVTKQWILLLALTALLIGLLAGCGGNAKENNEGASSSSSASASPATEESDDAAAEATPEPDAPTTRTVTTLAGEVEIPVNPQRIVLTYDDDVDHMIALGLKPVAVPLYQRTDNIDGYFPYLADQMQGVETFPLSADFEPILAAQPDLIIAGYHHREVLQDLQKIAPTIYFEWEVDWRNTHLEMGRVLGLEEKAQANVDAFNAEMEKTKAYLAETIGDEPVAFIRVRQNQLELYGGAGTGSSASFILYDLLGLTPVEEAVTDVWGEPFSLESFTRLKAEHIFLNVQENEENNALVDDFLSNALYKNVPAIQKDHIYRVPTYPWERGGPIAFTKGMEDLREMVKPQ
jgi:iron complex transport system substrate-binding protein